MQTMTPGLAQKVLAKAEAMRGRGEQITPGVQELISEASAVFWADVAEGGKVSTGETPVQQFWSEVCQGVQRHVC